MLNNDILLVIALKCHNIQQFSNMNEIIYCKDKIQKWMISRIHMRLEQKGLNATEFIAKMIESEGVMSGSFILQCLYDEEYDGSDIDVFILDDTRECMNGFVDYHKIMADSQSEADIAEFQEMLHKSNNHISREQMRNTNIYRNLYITDAFEKYISNIGICNSVSGETYIDGTYQTWDYLVNGSKIQIIYIKKDKLLMEYINNFDFDICSTAFNGHEVSAKNWQNIIDKVIVINNEGIVKSIGQGDDIHTIDYLKDTLNWRIKKYKTRGFTFIDDTSNDIFDKYINNW